MSTFAGDAWCVNSAAGAGNNVDVQRRISEGTSMANAFIPNNHRLLAEDFASSESALLEATIRWLNAGGGEDTCTPANFACNPQVREYLLTCLLLDYEFFQESDDDGIAMG